MDRWWTDPSRTREVLSLVDDRDITQGVGTAVLGYHGLAEEVLRPLADSTLIDADIVVTKLKSLDVSPVAKALANATRPVVGDSADRYGELLAQDLHSRAVESTGRLIANLVSTGMAWPVAIDRAASVHGVPVERLGKVGATLRAPALAKLTQADVADRALMDYAAHVGRRESVPEVVSKQYREREWREELVTRDSIGRFADKPDGSLRGLSAEARSSYAERVARKQRKQAKKARQEVRPESSAFLDALKARAEQARAEEKKSLVSLGAQVKQDGDLEARLMADLEARVEAKQMARLEGKMLAAVEALKNRRVDEEAEYDELFTVPDYVQYDGEKYPGYVLGTDHQQHFVLVDRRLLERAVDVGGFNWAQLLDTGAVFNQEPLTKDELREVVRAYSIEADRALDDVAILVLDGELAWDEGFTAGKSQKLAEGGLYDIRKRSLMAGHKGLEYEDDYDLGLKAYVTPVPGSPTASIVLPYATAVLGNAEDFEVMRSIRKSRVWREQDVVRDDLGRFAEEGNRGELVRVDEAAARRARLQRKRAKQARRAAQPQQSSLVAALQARQQDFKGQAAGLQSVSAQRSVDAESSLENRLMADLEARTLARLERRALEKLADRRAALEDFASKHEDWRELKALKFDFDEDRLSIEDIFGMDVYNGRSLQQTVSDEERLEVIDFVSGRIRPAGVVADRMWNVPKLVAHDSRQVLDRGSPVYLESADGAMGFAMAEADELNRVSDDQMRQWMPFVVNQTETRNFPLYVPMVVEVARQEEDVIVLGSDADWAALKRGEHLRLTPLDGYDQNSDQPGQGLFSELFQTVGSDEDVGRQNFTHEKPDFYIRAFRLTK